MNLLKTFIASSIIATITLSATAQSDELMDIIHPESADLFHYDDSLKASEPTGIFSLNDDYASDHTWSYEYEEYVDQSDFLPDNNINNAGLVNRYLESNPTASGKVNSPVFKWDGNYDGYMIY